MAPDSTATPSRRALLAALVGAGVASVAAAFGHPRSATATNDEAILLGNQPSDLDGVGVNEAFSTTEIYTTAGHGFVATAGATSGTTHGLYGSTFSTGGAGVNGLAWASEGAATGVIGTSSSVGGRGVAGFANAATGVTSGVYGRAHSTAGRGVDGYASALTGATRGVMGTVASPGGSGVQGYTGTGIIPAPMTRTGVFGQADQGTAGVGVRGHSSTGTGVYGSSTTGIAIRAAGRVKLDNCAGIATIAVGSSSFVVTPGIDLLSTSAVVATLMGSAGPVSTTVSRVAVNASANTFTIVLTAMNTAANPVKVAWHVFG